MGAGPQTLGLMPLSALPQPGDSVPAALFRGASHPNQPLAQTKGKASGRRAEVCGQLHSCLTWLDRVPSLSLASKYQAGKVTFHRCPGGRLTKHRGPRIGHKKSDGQRNELASALDWIPVPPRVPLCLPDGTPA